MSIYSNIHEMIFLHDPDGFLIHTNRYLTEAVGYSSQELAGKKICDLLSRDDGFELDAYLQQVKTDGYYKGTAHLMTKAGTAIAIEYQGAVFQSRETTTQIRVICRDISEQIKIQRAFAENEAKLKESEQRFRDIFENINEGIYLHDLEGNFIDVNAFFTRNMGYSKSGLLTKKVSDLIPQKHRHEFDGYLRRIIDSGHEKGLFKVETKHGSIHTVEYSNSLVQGPDGPVAVRGVARDVTEQLALQKALKKSQKELTESEQKYRDLFENINAYIYIHDLDGNYIETNAHFFKNMGYSKSEMLTKNIRDLIPPEHEPGYREYLIRIRTNGSDEGAITVVAKDGSLRVAEYTNSLIYGQDGPIAIRGLARDITEELKARKALKQSENKLKESEKKYRDIFENINAIIYIHELDGRCIEANNHFIKMMGYSIQELQTKTIGDLIPENHRPGYEAYLKRIRTNGHDEGVFKLVTRNGDKRIVEYTNSLIHGKDGPVAIRGLARDITEEFKARKALNQSETKLRENERKFRDIFENINEYIYLTDLAGNLLDMNPHFIKNIGYSKSELLTKSIKDLMPEDYRSEFNNYLKRIKDHGFDKGLLNVITKKGRTRVVHYTNSLVQGENGPTAIRGVARDITEEFKARNALQKSEEELRIARDNLERRVQERTRELQKSNQELEEKTKGLEEANIALRVLLNKKNEAQEEIEERMLTNIKDLILPILRKVKLGELSASQKSYLDVVESNLSRAIAPFRVDITSRFYSLTPAEIQVANLIREGKATKEIAQLLNLAVSTIHTHRDNIRIKLGIKNRKVNLRTHLIAIQK